MRNRLQLIIIGIFIFSFALGQNKKMIEPKGIYAEIQVAEQNEMIKLLGDEKTVDIAVDSVFKNIKHYNPTVLYVFSNILFLSGEESNGLDWYLFAELSAIYDANRCADTTAYQVIIKLEKMIGPAFLDYKKSHKKEYKKGIKNTIELFNLTKQDYDIRWINLSGMDVITYSLDSNSKQKPLSVPVEKWKDIKEKTIKQFRDSNLEIISKI